MPFRCTKEMSGSVHVTLCLLAIRVSWHFGALSLFRANLDQVTFTSSGDLWWSGVLPWNIPRAGIHVFGNLCREVAFVAVNDVFQDGHLDTSRCRLMTHDSFSLKKEHGQINMRLMLYLVEHGADRYTRQKTWLEEDEHSEMYKIKLCRCWHWRVALSSLLGEMGYRTAPKFEARRKLRVTFYGMPRPLEVIVAIAISMIMISALGMLLTCIWGCGLFLAWDQKPGRGIGFNTGISESRWSIVSCVQVRVEGAVSC